jgi:hypothetical protein
MLTDLPGMVKVLIGSACIGVLVHAANALLAALTAYLERRGE